MRNLLIFIALMLCFLACDQQRTAKSPDEMIITSPIMEKVKKQLIEKHGNASAFRIERGVNQVGFTSNNPLRKPQALNPL